MMSRFLRSLDRPSFLLAGAVLFLGILAGSFLGTREPSTTETANQEQQWTLRYPVSSPSWDTKFQDQSPRYVIRNGAECFPHNTLSHTSFTIWRVGGSLAVSDGAGERLGVTVIPDEGEMTHVRFGFAGDDPSRHETVSTAEQNYGAECRIIVEVPLAHSSDTYVIRFDPDPFELTYTHQDLQSHGLLTATTH